MKTTLFALLLLSFSCAHGHKPTVIAHRGASGYLPEHTLEAVAMAHAMNPDFIEPDVVMTKDNHLVVLHDIHLDTTTNVADVYPSKKRKDGRYYAIDFSLKEIKKLRVHERENNGKRVFSKRFPKRLSHFQVPTLAEWIELVQGLNQSRNKQIGIYVEFKSPSFHKQNGKDIGNELLKILKRYGYEENPQLAFIQCFDPDYLRALKTNIPKVQLIGKNEWKMNEHNYDEMLTRDGIREIASYAQGIGPHYGQAFSTQVVKFAKEYMLLVHPYTLRKDSLPKSVDSYSALKKALLAIEVDGYFTDFPDL